MAETQRNPTIAESIQSFGRSFGSNLEAPVKQHLTNVYACLTMTTLAASMAAYSQVVLQWTWQWEGAKWVYALGSLLLLLKAINTPDNGKNLSIRLGYLLGFGVLAGLGLGPLLQVVMYINPSIIITALTSTVLIFVCFSISALVAPRGYWLFLGGSLMTMISVILLTSLFNIFWQSYSLYLTHVCAGLFMMCGFVLYDTHLIIEKRRMGDKNFVAHAAELFIDLLGIFRRLLILLSEKELNQSNSESSDNGKRKNRH